MDRAQRKLLRRMVKGGFRRVDSANGNYDFQIRTAELLDICRTKDLSEYIKQQQTRYCAHVIRKPNSAVIKQLIFNSDHNTKTGKPVPNLRDQVQENLGLKDFDDQFFKECRDRKH